MASIPPEPEALSPFFDGIVALREIVNAIDPASIRVVNGRPRDFSDNARAKVLHHRRNTCLAKDLIQNKIIIAWSIEDQLPVAISPRVVLVFLNICLKDGLNLSNELRDKISQTLLAFADWVEAKVSATV